jgi:Cu-Zn family superoxide dismutase
MSRQNFSLVANCVLTALLATGCACKDFRKTDTSKKDDNQNQEIAYVGAPEAAQKSVTTAVAHVKSVKKDSAIQGKVTFTKVADGVKVVADFDGLTPGEHGFHVHEHGDCGGEEASAAGPHFNPTNKDHAGPDSLDRHEGDLGNLVADAKGHAHYERIDKAIKLDGPNSIIGRSVIVHADRDDYKTQPAGASGAKIVCGVIKADQ